MVQGTGKRVVSVARHGDCNICMIAFDGLLGLRWDRYKFKHAFNVASSACGRDFRLQKHIVFLGGLQALDGSQNRYSHAADVCFGVFTGECINRFG